MSKKKRYIAMNNAVLDINIRCDVREDQDCSWRSKQDVIEYYSRLLFDLLLDQDIRVVATNVEIKDFNTYSEGILEEEGEE